MLVKTSRLLLIVAALAYGQMAFAAQAYVGLNVGQVQFSQGDEDISLSSVYLRVGSQLDENFAVELRLGTGIGKEQDQGIDFEIAGLNGVYLRSGWLLGESFYPYVNFGFSRFKVDSFSQQQSDSGLELDLSVGLGADMYFGEDWVLNLEATEYLLTESGSALGLNLGVAWRF